MSRYIDVSNLDIPSDENDYDELVAFADKVAEMITDAPSIELEPKRGEWIVHSNGKMCDCSVCNESYDRTFEYVDEWNFCPNCGARMKGADDE